MEAPNDKERAYYEYILCEDRYFNEHTRSTCEDTGLPVEALFNDLLVFNLMFPLVPGTRARWDAQPKEVRESILVANIDDITLHGNKMVVTCKTWGASGVQLQKGRVYRLSPRLVDFNLYKVLSTLLELDLRTPPQPPLGHPKAPVPAFLQLISSPRTFASFKANDGEEDDCATSMLREEKVINNVFSSLARNLDLENAEKLVLKSTQRSALWRVMSHRLTVIWGPPGLFLYDTLLKPSLLTCL